MKKSKKNTKLYDCDLDTVEMYVRKTNYVKVTLADFELLNEISIRKGFSKVFDFEGFKSACRKTINEIAKTEKQVVWNGSYSVVQLEVQELHTDFANRTSVRCLIRFIDGLALFDCEKSCFVALAVQKQVDADHNKSAVEPNLFLRELYYEACAEDIREVA